MVQSPHTAMLTEEGKGIKAGKYIYIYLFIYLFIYIFMYIFILLYLFIKKKTWKPEEAKIAHAASQFPIEIP